MKPASCSITPEGYPCIFLTTLCTLAFAMLGCPVMTVICLILVWFSLNFFRDPERVVPDGEDTAVSPADGRIVKIEDRQDPVTGEIRQCVCIFMNVFNVHVNRVPVAGTISAIKYYPGKFFNASLDKASTDNERCAYQLTDADENTWTFVQIAGLVARRIVCRVDTGDELAKGQRFGMIRFGSRVDLYMPYGYSPTVTIGQTVLAGQTVIARKTTV